MDNSRCALMNQIRMTSFCVGDAVLFLDTHPCDRQALAYYQRCRMARQRALDEYNRLYGPLTPYDADISCDEYWRWVEGPWPWEGEV